MDVSYDPPPTWEYYDEPFFQDSLEVAGTPPGFSFSPDVDSLDSPWRVGEPQLLEPAQQNPFRMLEAAPGQPPETPFFVLPSADFCPTPVEYATPPSCVSEPTTPTTPTTPPTPADEKPQTKATKSKKRKRSSSKGTSENEAGVGLSRKDLLEYSSEQFDEYAKEITKRRKLSPGDQKLINQQRRLIKNRESASASRQRKKNNAEQLESKVVLLEHQNRKLQETINFLTKAKESVEMELKRYQSFFTNPQSITQSVAFLVIAFSFAFFVPPFIEQGPMSVQQTTAGHRVFTSNDYAQTSQECDLSSNLAKQGLHFPRLSPVPPPDEKNPKSIPAAQVTVTSDPAQPLRLEFNTTLRKRSTLASMDSLPADPQVNAGEQHLRAHLSSLPTEFVKSSTLSPTTSQNESMVAPSILDKAMAALSAPLSLSGAASGGSRSPSKLGQVRLVPTKSGVPIPARSLS